MDFKDYVSQKHMVTYVIRLISVWRGLFNIYLSLQNCMCPQRKTQISLPFRQADQSLCCLPEDALDPLLPTEHHVMTDQAG